LLVGRRPKCSVKYSVITAVRNRPGLLRRCLEGVSWQTFRDHEALVVDYGSDPPVSLPSRCRARVIRVEASGWNESAAKNAGIANARGEYVVLINCDCIMGPRALDIVDALLARAQRELQVYWQRFDLTKRGTWLVARLGQGWLLRHAFFRYSASRLVLALLRKAGCGEWRAASSYGDFLAVKREPLVTVGGFDEQMSGWGAMDDDLKNRLALLGYRAKWIRGTPILHQYHREQARKKESWRRNVMLARQAMSSGDGPIRNGGPRVFERYRSGA